MPKHQPRHTLSDPKSLKAASRRTASITAKQKRSPATTVKELWAQREQDSRRFLKKARKCLNSRAAATAADTTALKCLTGAANCLGEPIYSDLGLRRKMAELLVVSYKRKRAEMPTLDLGFGTLLNSSWDTSIEATEIDIHRIQAESRAALSAMFESWLSIIELQPFSNLRHESGGALIGVHCHFFGHGILSRRHTEARRKAVSKRFKSRLEGAKPLVVKWIGDTDLDLVRTISYPWKAPHRSKTLYVHPVSGRGNLHQSEANDRFVRYLRMVQILSMLRLDRVIYGANQGATIRADALREAKSWLRTGESDRQPPMHSAAVTNYWVDLWRRFGEPRFNVPIIKYKKC